MQSYRAVLEENKIRTRVALIDTLLRALGWDVSDPAGVMPEYKARWQWPEALSVMLLFLVGAHAAVQAHDAPLHVMRSATLERPLLVMSTGASVPGEVYVDDVRIRVVIEDGARVYRVFRRGITRILHVPLDASLRYVAFDLKRNRFELLSPGLRVELEDYGLLDQIITAADGTGGKAYPMLGFAIVQLSLQANPVDAVHAIEALPGVVDVRLMIEGPRRVPR